MATEKIFSITGKEIPKEKSWKNGKAEGLEVAKISYINGLHVFTILIGCGLAMSILALIPRHNSVKDPTYWFEIILPAGFEIIFSATILVLDLSILMDRETLISPWMYLKVNSTYLLSWIIPFCSCYFLWTAILDYNHPMPFVGLICKLSSSIVAIITTPIFVLLGHFEKQEFKRKSNNFFGYQLLWFVDGIVKDLLSRVFSQLRETDAQCLVAILIPIAKRSTHLVISKVIKQMVGSENERANVLLAVTVNVSYGLFTSICLIGARSITIICMVVGEFLIQLNMTYQVVKLHKKVAALDQSGVQKSKAVTRLLLAELSEGLIPLAYAISFSLAYYGPNGNLIGHVRNESWNYTPVKDARWTFIAMLGLFAVDSMCLFLNSAIAWIFCKINLFDEFCIVMQKYWHIIALKIISVIYQYYFFLDVNLAFDKTLKFDWITSNKTLITFMDTDYL